MENDLHENSRRPRPSGVKIAALVLAAAALALAIAALIVACLNFGKSDGAEPYLAAYEKARRSVVQVYSEGRVGSGVIYKISGGKTYVITNHHVAGEGKELSVRFADFEEKTPARLLGYDGYHDIALIEADETFEGAAAAEIGEKPLDGQAVIAVGNNLRYGIAVFEGAVSRANRMLAVTDESKVVPVYAVTCPVNAGMSGGGLFTLSGKLVGINTYQTPSSTENEKLRPIDGVSYSVPVSIAEKIALQAAAERNSGQISKLSVSAHAFDDADRTVNIIFDALYFTARYASDGLRVVSAEFDSSSAPHGIEGGAPEEGDTVVRIGNLRITRDTGYEALYSECLNYLHDPSLESEPLEVELKRGSERVTVKYQFDQLKKY